MESEILSVFDDTTAEILAAASTGPVSAETIHRRSGVPKSTLYRRLGRLVDVGALRSSPELNENNTHYFVYESLLRDLSVSVRAGEIRVTATFDRCETPETVDWTFGTPHLDSE